MVVHFFALILIGFWPTTDILNGRIYSQSAILIDSMPLIAHFCVTELCHSVAFNVCACASHQINLLIRVLYVDSILVEVIYA